MLINNDLYYHPGCWNKRSVYKSSLEIEAEEARFFDAIRLMPIEIQALAPVISSFMAYELTYTEKFFWGIKFTFLKQFLSIGDVLALLIFRAHDIGYGVRNYGIELFEILANEEIRAKLFPLKSGLSDYIAGQSIQSLKKTLQFVGKLYFNDYFNWFRPGYWELQFSKLFMDASSGFVPPSLVNLYRPAAERPIF